VSDYVAEQRQQAEELDDMATGALTDEQANTSALTLAGRSHQLLPLHCAVESKSVLVAVAVIERTQSEGHEQLLKVLAMSLLESGEISPPSPSAK
jgi:hypothetical protein